MNIVRVLYVVAINGSASDPIKMDEMMNMNELNTLRDKLKGQYKDYDFIFIHSEMDADYKHPKGLNTTVEEYINKQLR